MNGELRVATGTPLVVDSSVALKWFLEDEPGSDVATDLLAAHAEDSVAILVPELLLIEVAHAFRRRAVLAEVYQTVDSLFEFDLLIVPLEPWLLRSAARIAAEARLALYDAVFVALAAQLDAELVTADRAQAASGACRVRLIG
jgi:predicted nucleic acid-binding protein